MRMGLVAPASAGAVAHVRIATVVNIARAIGDPEHARFGEILIFINRPGRRDMLRRVQWTMAALGLVLLVFGLFMVFLAWRAQKSPSSNHSATG